MPHTQLKSRGVGTPEGHAALIHALAHIELNAIDLALDVCVRFHGLPEAFYRDWVGVAREEALHFRLLTAHLSTLGYAYGDFPAHAALWEMAERTAGDVLHRLAIVPRVLEARGLDASPAVRAKLAGIGDEAGAAIIDVILRDEIGHVATGNRWLAYVCSGRGLSVQQAASELAARFAAPRPRAVELNHAARLAAGFSADELAQMTAEPAARRP